MQPLELNDPAKIKAATTYNSAADHFDEAPLAFWNVYGQRTIERLALAPSANVLDVGCGSGASAIPAAERVGSSGSVLGVDLAVNLLIRARAKASQQNLHNVTFTLADMTALGFPDSQFDAIVGVFSIFFVPDMAGTLKELWRMVKPGGKLAVTTWGSDFFEPVYSIWNETIKSIRPDLYSTFNPWERIQTPEQLRSLFSSSDISPVDIVPEEGFQALRSAEDWWIIALGSGLRATIDAMQPNEAERLRQTTVKWVQDNAITSIRTSVIYACASK